MEKEKNNRKRPIKKTTGLMVWKDFKIRQKLVTHKLDPFRMLKSILKI